MITDLELGNTLPYFLNGSRTVGQGNTAIPGWYLADCDQVIMEVQRATPQSHQDFPASRPRRIVNFSGRQPIELVRSGQFYGFHSGSLQGRLQLFN